MSDTREISASVIGGVDTHKDTHTAVALGATGVLLGTETFPATQAGYVSLLLWLRSHGQLDRIGVEGTGSYGSGLSHYLHTEGVTAIEVNRPSRQARRRRGKSDAADAEAAARATLAGEVTGVPKAQNGAVEAMRILRIQRRSAIRGRTISANQMHALVLTAPEPLRGSLRKLTIAKLVVLVSKRRKTAVADALSATHRVLRALARRWLALTTELAELDIELLLLVKQTAPALLALKGVGVEVASTLLVAAGDNPERMVKESSFAALCACSPVDASSGRQHRHRLNRGGNRDANRALWVVAFSRLSCDPATIKYVARRTAEGLSKREAIRCLKRFIAREVFKLLRNIRSTKQTESCPSIAA